MTYEERIQKNKNCLKGKEKLSKECEWSYESKEYGVALMSMNLPYLDIQNIWCDEYVDILIENDIKNLSFSYIKNVDNNLEIFSKLYFLKDLTLLGLSYGEKDYSFNGLKYLINLEMLDCRGSQSSTPIDFSYLKKLKVCSLAHTLHKKNKTLFECITLEKLSVYGYLDKDFSFSLLINLKILTLQTTSLLELKGIDKLQKLQSFKLEKSKKIKDFEEISKVKSLKRLTLKYCRVDNLIESISQLKKLEFLFLENVGKIESISALKNCQNLKEIFIGSGTTNIVDGDLSVLFKLPKLKKVSIATQKHYSHTNEELHKHTGQ